MKIQRPQSRDKGMRIDAHKPINRSDTRLLRIAWRRWFVSAKPLNCGILDVIELEQDEEAEISN